MDLFMSLPIWQWWIILGLILLILEIFISGFLVACFGISALLTAITLTFDASLSVQLITFGLLNIATLYLLRPFLQKQFAGKEVKSGVDALIGRELRLEEDYTPSMEYSLQKIQGDVWRVRSKTNEAITAGTQVRVVAREGLTLIIEAI